MHYFLLIIVVAMVALQSVIQKQYNISAAIPNSTLFSAASSFTAMFFFILSSRFQLSFSFELLPYSIGFALALSLAFVGQFLAIRHGSLSLTMLIVSYSLLVPTLYGIVVLRESLGNAGYAGIVLLLISLLLINIQTGSFSFSWKWLFYVVIAFLGNGLCSTIQKMQQLEFKGHYKNEFMILATLMAGVTLFVISVCNHRVSLIEVKDAIRFAIPNGIANGTVNLLVLMLTGIIPNSILFPSVSAGGIVLGFVSATVFYKERLSCIQRVGYFLGALSVLLLNI